MCMRTVLYYCFKLYFMQSGGRPIVMVEPQQGRFDVNVRGSLVVRCSVQDNQEAQVTWTYGPNRPLPSNVSNLVLDLLGVYTAK